MKVCKRMGGKVKKGVCIVGGFPTFKDTDEWWGESISATALEDGTGMVAVMSPEDAKKFFPPSGGVDEDGVFHEFYHESSIKELRKRIREGKPINPPWLETCHNQGKGMQDTWVVGHEGRNRIESARREGIKSIPVIIRPKPRFCSNPWAELSENRKELKEANERIEILDAIRQRR